jgi:hypothetical protein
MLYILFTLRIMNKENLICIFFCHPFGRSLVPRLGYFKMLLRRFKDCVTRTGDCHLNGRLSPVLCSGPYWLWLVCYDILSTGGHVLIYQNV